MKNAPQLFIKNLKLTVSAIAYTITHLGEILRF